MPVIARKIFSSNVLVSQVYILIEPMTDENSPKFYKGHALVDIRNRYVHVYDENCYKTLSEEDRKIGMGDHYEVVLRAYRKSLKIKEETK